MLFYKLNIVFQYLFYNTPSGFKFTLGKLCKQLGFSCGYAFALFFFRNATFEAYKFAKQNNLDKRFIYRSGFTKKGTFEYTIL